MRLRLTALAMTALACAVVGVYGISLHPPASWSANHDALPDPVKPRPNPKLPAVHTEPLVLAPGQTVVSVTFDDGRASNALGAKILTEHGLAGTFFLNSGNIGKPGYLTLSEVDTIALAGNEIAGHTVNHKDLLTLPSSEIFREVCQDRTTWLSWGFPVRSFAFPFAIDPNGTQQYVTNCGYNSARSLGETRTVHMPENADPSDCSHCAWSESVPPPNPYYTRAPAQVRSNWTIEELEAQVIRVTDGDGSPYSGDGGWVQLTFHGICPTDCSDITTPVGEFEEFVTWLADQQEDGKLIVRTVGDVIGGDVHAAMSGPSPAAALVNGDLQANQDGAVPCWQRAAYGNNKPELSLVPGRQGGTAERIVMRDYHDGQAGLVSAQDLGDCAVAVSPGDTPTVSAWYRSSVPTRFVVYYRTDRGNWSYVTSGPVLPASTDWAQTLWKVPPVPKGATAISFGLVITQNGELTTTDYGLRK